MFIPRKSRPNCWKSFRRYFTGRTKPYNMLLFGNDNISYHALRSIVANEGFKDVMKSIDLVTTLKMERDSNLLRLVDELKWNKIGVMRKQFQNLEQYLKKKKDEGNEVDLALVASFGLMIPEYIINLFPEGILILHPSLLPKYRGATPIQHALMNQEQKTGVSIIEISRRTFDAGDILLQKEIPIKPNDTFKTLSEELAKLGGNCMVECLQDLENLRKKSLKQDPILVTRAPILKKEKAMIRWDLLDAKEVAAHQRGLFGSNVQPFTMLQIGRNTRWRSIFFKKLIPVDEDSSLYKLLIEPVDKIAEPGHILWNYNIKKKVLCVKCKKGWVMTVDEIKVESKDFIHISSFIYMELQDKNYFKENQFVFKFATDQPFESIYSQ